MEVQRNEDDVAISSSSPSSIELSQYEKIREQNIKEIQKAMEATLGEISTLKKDIIEPLKPSSCDEVEAVGKRTKRSKLVTFEGVRKSNRERKVVSYKEDILDIGDTNTGGVKVDQKKRKFTSSGKEKSKSRTVVKESKKVRRKNANERHGFARGLSPERIVGVTNVPGELYVCIKWKNSDEADLVAAREANVRIPQMIIKYYEDRLTWLDDHQ